MVYRFSIDVVHEHVDFQFEFQLIRQADDMSGDTVLAIIFVLEK